MSLATSPKGALWFEPDHDNAPALIGSEGFRIQLSIGRNGLVAEGAYSILYETTARTLLSEGEARRIAFKVFCTKDCEDAAMDEYELLMKLDSLGGHLPRAIAFGHAKTSRYDETGYPTIAQEYVTGEPVQSIGESLYEKLSSPDDRLEYVLQATWAISKAVDAINEVIRHGDLSYTNVYLEQANREGSYGHEMNSVIIDLGQAALKRRLGTYEKKGTAFFSAPELFGESGLADYVRGRSSADAYSIGALLAYMLLRGEYSDEDDFLSSFYDASAKGETEVRRWATITTARQRDLAEITGSVVASCMRESPLERPGLDVIRENLLALCTPGMQTQESLAYIKATIDTPRLDRETLPTAYQIRPSALVAGRNRESLEIARMLQKGRIAYLHGFGGIGKTSLARSFAAESLDEQDSLGITFLRAYFISFTGTMRETLDEVGSRLPADDSGARDDQSLAAYALDVMERVLGPKDLVILDDVYDPGKTLREVCDPLLLRMLTNGTYRLLITSRYPAYGALYRCAVPVNQLDDGTLEDIYLQQTGGNTSDFGLLSELFEIVERNTLAVKLVGGLVGDSAGMVTLEEVVSLLKRGRLGSSEVDMYCFGDGGDGRQMNLRRHISSLLSLAGLSQDERSLMSRLLLMPTQGMRISTLRDAIRRDEPRLESAFGSLVSKGWVERSPEEGKIRIHSLVRDVCLDAEDIAPRRATTAGYLDALWDVAEESLEVGDLDTASDVEAVYEMSMTLDLYEPSEQEAKTLLRRQAVALDGLGKTSSKLRVLEELIRRMGPSFPGEGKSAVRERAKALSDYSDALNEIGRHSEAIEVATKALATLGWRSTDSDGNEGMSESDRHQLSLVSELLARRGYAVHDQWASGHSADLREALLDKEQALRILETIGGDSWQKATILCTLAHTENSLSHLDGYDPALKERAIKDEEYAVSLIRGCRHSPERERKLLLAASLNFLGYFLCGSEEPFEEARLEESLQLKEEAIEIRYRLLRPNHMDIARSHNNISLSLKRIGALEDALYHALVAAKIRRERFDSEYSTTNKLVDENILDIQKRLNLDEADIQEQMAATVIPNEYKKSAYCIIAALTCAPIKTTRS